jgi:Acetyltransferase (GNAT) domain
LENVLGNQVNLEFQADRALQECGSVDGTVRILRSAPEVESVREFWSSCPGTRDSDIDIFFLDGQRNSPDAPQPRVLVLYRGRIPVALLAGKIVRRKFTFRLGYFPLFSRMVNVMTIPYGGLRGDASAEDCHKLIREINKCLKNGEADVALIHYVDANSALFHCAKTEPKFLFRDHFTPLRPHRKRKLPSSIEKLHEGSSQGSKQFRRVAKKLSNEFSGQVRVDRFEALADLDRMLAVVEEIAKKTWQRKVSTIGFNIKDASLLEVLKTEAEGGHLRVYTLYLGEKPCAFWIGAVYQRTFFSDFLGYDPDYARYSPGTFLLSQMLEELCAQGVEEIDFGFSDEEYKKRFGNVMWQDSNVHVYAPSLAGLTLSAMRLITVVPHEAARALLKRTNLYQNAKMAWRKMAKRAEGQKVSSESLVGPGAGDSSPA